MYYCETSFSCLCTSFICFSIYDACSFESYNSAKDCETDGECALPKVEGTPPIFVERSIGGQLVVDVMMQFLEKL